MSTNATYTVNVQSVFGNQRVQLGTVSLTDGPTCTMVTGWDYINGGVSDIQTASAEGTGLIVNTAVAGSFRLQSAVSGGVYNVVLFGR